MRASLVQMVIVPLVLAVGVAATGATVVAMRPTLAEFLAKADSVCVRGDTSLTGLQIGTSMASMSTFAAKLADSTSKTLAELRALAPPPGVSADELLGEMARAAEFGRAMSKAATERDFP